MRYGRIESGEICVLHAIEIVSIPDISILINNTDMHINSMEYVKLLKKNFSALLNSIFSAFGKYFSNEILEQDISLELMWYAEPVKNQTYRAKIRLFLVLRAIGSTKAIATQYLSGMYEICKNMLVANKYTMADSDAAYMEKYKTILWKKCCTVAKEDRISNLQNFILPNCYSYDKMSFNELDMSNLLNVLCSIPGAAVIYQLIPTLLSDNEKNYIELMSINLDNLSKGMMGNQFAHVANTIAERYAEIYKYYELAKDGALFLYNILLFAEDNELHSLIASVNRLLEGDAESGGGHFYNDSMTAFPKDDNYVFSLPWYLSECISDMRYSNHPLNLDTIGEIRRLSEIITSEEAGNFFRLPIGSNNISAGININYSRMDNRNYNRRIINAGDVQVGKLKSSPENWIGFNKEDINRHMLIVGTTGTGKTTYAVGLLDTLYKKHKLPFLVIEPVKSEYRALVDSISDIQMFTPGNDKVSPFIINPFVPPKGVSIGEYKSVLSEAFAAGVTMSEPLDSIFKQSIDNCYSEFGWLDSNTIGDSNCRVFNISDFMKVFKRTFNTWEYTGDARNIATAGLVRLTSMVKLFDNYNSISIEDILSKPTIIELEKIRNNNDKAVIISLLLLNIGAYISCNYSGDGILRNIIMLDEAHVLLETKDSNQEGSAQPNRIAQDLLRRILLEWRSKGFGMIVADQSPKAVGDTIIGQTNIKLAFGLVKKDDKEVFANSTNLDESQINRMTQFGKGEAFFFMNEMSAPEEVEIPDYRAEHNIRITMSDDEISARSKYWDDKKDKLMPYPECVFLNQNFIGICNGTCSINVREQAFDVAKKIFHKYFGKKTNDRRLLIFVWNNFQKEMVEILSSKNVPLTNQLICCTKMCFLRKVKYETDIKLNNEEIANNLKRTVEKCVMNSRK